jgi:peptidoglycan DL-endopeptidase CwlO
MNRSKKLFLLAVFLMVFNTKECWAEKWRITAYDACVACCGKSDGITASGKKAIYGYVACNWLKFGTKVSIEGLGIFTVQDRGAKSLFGSKKNHIKHLDVYMDTHREALKFGNQYREVVILK